MKLRIRNSYRTYSDANLHKLGSRISESLKGNAYFPDPKPSQPDLEKTCQEFNLAVARAGRNDRTMTSAKNDKKVVLIRMLDELAEYVTGISNDDKTMIMSSGFDIVDSKASQQPLGTVEKLTVEIGGSGVAVTRVNKVTGAKAYIHQYTPDPITPDSIWISETTTDRENTFTNLKSISKYWFRVIAVGKGKRQEYSLPVAMVIQ